MLTVLIPAHNEGQMIVATIKSLQQQTVVPDKIIVMADNCTDNTADVASAAGAMVIATRDNKDKKAGALNQGIASVIGSMIDSDFIMTVDADSVLVDTWVETAIDKFSPEMGGISGAYVARSGNGFVTLLQRAEYAQERRRISRRGGDVDVLSGTAVLLPVAVLRELNASRGYIYDVNSLTEDFEITLALQGLGYKPKCFKELRVVTDVMESWGDLYRQRLRWQRGTIETLRSYGYVEHTKRLWRTQIWTYASSLVLLAVLASWVLVLFTGFHWSIIWLMILPVFATEQFVSSRRAGLGPALVAGSLIPMWGYDTFRLAIYWIALVKAIRNTQAVWN